MTTHPHHERHIRIVALVTAALLTAVFHVTLGEQPFIGLSRAIMTVGIFSAVHILLVFLGRRPNMWAYTFAVPALISALASAVSPSPVVAVVGFFVLVASVALFVYWISAPTVSFWQARSLWPSSLFLETIFPFERFEQIWTGLGMNRRWTGIGIGLIIALPLLLIFGSLFASADLLFREAVHSLFSVDQLPEYVFKIIRDGLVGLYLLGASWLFLTRRSGGERLGEVRVHTADRTIGVTVLGSLNVLFLIFLAFQFVYFFGGQDVITRHGITYAQYAREGFFQLLAVSGLVFLLTLGVYFGNEMRDKLFRMLTLLLVGQTAVVIASAVSRMMLYIDAYGFTVARVWALAIILWIALVLFGVFFAALSRVRFTFVVRVTAVAALCAGALMISANIEGRVAQANVERYVSGRTTQMDIPYLVSLDAPAVPALVRLVQSQWPQENITFGGHCDNLGMMVEGSASRLMKTCVDSNIIGYWDRATVRAFADDVKGVLRTRVDQSWRVTTLADLRALAALEQIK